MSQSRASARDLHPIVRDEIYKITAEALRNAFRHAQAGRVEVDIRYDDEQFRLCVRDDGKGIDAAVLAHQGLEGHYGLRGMPERAALIGGKLAVWSEVGAGTEVELRLPASTVYATSGRRSWWSRLLPFRRSHTASDERRRNEPSGIRAPATPRESQRRRRGFTYAMRDGRQSSTAVPAPSLLHTESVPPMSSARSRIPGTP